MTRWMLVILGALVILALVLMGYRAFFPDEGKRQAREHDYNCRSIQTACMDVCKDRVTEPTIVDLGQNQKGKVECLRLCFDEYRQCLEGR